MIGVQKLLVDITSQLTCFVRFGDGLKGETKGAGKLVCVSSPSLEDVILVKGLIVNLISISHLCEQDLN